ncbi:MAG: hypothetical protein ACWA47_01670 [Brevirhabdus sp.]
MTMVLERVRSIGALVAGITLAGHCALADESPILPVSVQPPTGPHIPVATLPRNLSRPAVAGTVLNAPDISPFGLDCTPSVSLSPVEGGLSRVVLSAPCHLNSVVRVGHSLLSFDARTSNVGALDLVVPVLNPASPVAVTFPDGVRLVAGMSDTDLAVMRRVVLAWDGIGNPVELAATGSTRTTERHRIRSVGGAVESFTALPGSGTVRLALRVTVTPTNCGKPFAIQMIEQGGPVEVQKTQLSIDLPDCDHVGEVLELKNVLPDLTLAHN